VRAVALVLLVLAAACSSSPPPPQTRYLMRGDAPDATYRVEVPVSIGLRRVSVAAYLAEQGLVVETGDREVRPAQHHLWAEPLDQGLRLALRAWLSQELGYGVSADPVFAGAWDYAVDVEVEELHGTRSGDARLVAGWRVARPDQLAELAAFRFARTEPVARAGYAALAEAEIALVRELAAAIADSLREIATPRAAKP
jgi:uncharacterized lipoprotein YmbA